MKEDIYPICREYECDFETRCRHFYHKICLELENAKNTIPFCPYCTRNISLNSYVQIAIKSKLEKEYLKSPEILSEVLKCSVEEGDLDLLKVLHSKGAKVHADNHYALRWSTENGHLDIVKNLVKQGAGDHADNDYALIWSAKKGNLDIVKYLVEQGALGFTLSTRGRPRTQGIVSRTSFSDEEKPDLIPKFDSSDFDSSENKSLPMDSGMERWRKILLMKRNL
jgi:hypothetical protein